MSSITTTTSYTKIANTNCRVNQQVKNLKTKIKPSSKEYLKNVPL